jgi:hypothetical protein
VADRSPEVLLDLDADELDLIVVEPSDAAKPDHVQPRLP